MSEASSGDPAAPARRRRWPGVLAWALWALAMLELAALVRLQDLALEAGRPDLAGPSASAVPYALAVLSAATVGALLASRRPAHPVGWLLIGLGLSLAATSAANGYAAYALQARPGALPAADYVAAYTVVLGGALPTVACLGFVLLLTPTGSPPSARWRWWARIAAAAPLLALGSSALLPFEQPYYTAANPFAVPALAGPLRVVADVAVAVTLLTVPVAAWSLVVRFRRARGVERQQLRWLALAAGVTVVLALVMVPFVVADQRAPLPWLSAACVASLPLATGAAIQRYRLYDLDRIISRTLVYGLLTLLLGLGYAGAVLLLGLLLPQDSPLVVAVATLVVAAAFQPARRRVQAAVDQRFDRRRYDAARILEGFSARLRQHVDLDTLTTELLAVVEQTMQPTRASLWLRPTAPPPDLARSGPSGHAAHRPGGPAGNATAT
jgi:hypothetical protein